MDMPIDVNQIQSMESSKTGVQVSQVNPMREASLREVALGVGARGGLAWEYDRINNILYVAKDKLDKSWDFKRLLISRPGKGAQSVTYTILPPVLVEANEIYDQEGEDKLTLADTTYKIESQAKFVSVAPSWRDYIVHEFPAVEKPHDSLLPQNNAERKIWKEAVQKGWENGISQADSIFRSDLNKMRRDFEGMIRYMNLANRGMVSKPFVAEAQKGVTGNGNELNIGERVLKITAKPQLNSNSHDWKPISTEGLKIE